MTVNASLDAEELAAYFALMEVGSLLQHAVEQQLRRDGDLSYVQFQILAGLGDAPGGAERMTDIADRLVHSRSGLTYQAAQLESAGLITRVPSVDDERSTTVTLTNAGRAIVRRVLPGHVALVRQLLLSPLDRPDIAVLTRTLTRVRDQLRAAPPRSAVAPRSPRAPLAASAASAARSTRAPVKPTSQPKRST
jgi:DNA-binding MarR family transcriptional regulator